MNAIEEIRRLYFDATAATIERDIARAIDLLKSMKDDDERSNSVVFASKGRALAAPRSGPVRRPTGLAAAAADQLLAGFARIASALKSPQACP